MNSRFNLSALNSRIHVRILLYYALSFVIPFIVAALALVALHVTPFGSHSLAIADAKFYINGELFFVRLLKGQENILYSFNNGLGGNEWSQFAWGGLSFGNFLAIFATLETMPTVFTWICVINLAICGLTMYILLAHINGHGVDSLVFSTSYALIGFNVVNCYQTLFFLGPQLLPLMVLGLILLVRGKNPILYILSLSFCTFFNFYFAFHLCVISLVLIIAYLCVYTRELVGQRKVVLIRWFVASLIGGLMAAPMWLTALKAYSGGGRLNQTSMQEYTFAENMPFIQIFSKLFTGANSLNELVIGLPNIFCGVLVTALVVLYFINNRIDIRRRRAAGIVLGIYLLTFYIHALTLAMHGGTHTNWFPYRYSYVFSFLLICLAVEEFRYIEELSVEEAKRCGTILLIVALIVFSTSYEYISGGEVLIDFVLLLFMWLSLWLYKTRPNKAPKRTLTLLLLVLVCINLYANFILSTRKVKDWELNLEEYSENIVVSGALVDAINMSDDTFFRMEKDTSESGSVAADSYLYNYNGVSHSGPSERMFVHQGLSRLGINWYDMRHWYSEGVPAATDSLLGLKYLISERDLSEEKRYEEKVDLDGNKIYLNPYALPISILSNDKVEGIELGDNPFQNLNTVWKAMTGGNQDIFTEQEDVTYTLYSDYSNQSITSEELRESATEIDVDEGGQDEQVEGEQSSSYIQYGFTAVKDGPIYVFDTSIPASDNGLPEPSIKYVGTYKAGDAVEGQFPLSAGIASGDLLRGYCVNLVFAYADSDVLAEYANMLNDREISLNVVHENNMTGSFTADTGQRILFTIPWDEGWKCYIDGAEVTINKTWNLFMSVEVPEGQHAYEMKFFPAWLNYALCISAVAFVGLVAVMLAWRKGTASISLDKDASAPTFPADISGVELTEGGEAPLANEATDA